jgi:nicotinamide riboside kinase
MTDNPTTIVPTAPTTIINLYGGPGAGKSTGAVYLFHKLKTQGENAELVREYVKEWVWTARKFSTYDQIYFLGKQTRQESLLFGKVDWIVTDSPVMMNLYYAQKYCPPVISEGVRACTLAYYHQAEDDGHKHVHVFLNRTKPYLSHGRFQNEDEAKEIDDDVKKVLRHLKVPFIETTSEAQDLDQLLVSLQA